ncbi:MAG: hypothetical protein VX341_06760 [Bdellovibrionota bacterium]|nr:hypothetical protein [Bdellovibrionota bacterium]
MSRKESAENNTLEIDKSHVIVTTVSRRKRTVRKASSLRPRRSALRVRSVRPLKAILNSSEVLEEEK